MLYNLQTDYINTKDFEKTKDKSEKIGVHKRKVADNIGTKKSNVTRLKTIFIWRQTLEFEHKPVMLEECIDGLRIKPDGSYVDGTIGGAGHSKEIIKRLNTNGLLIGIDRDEDALTVAKERLKEFSNAKFVHGNHDDIKEILENLEIEKVDGILLDLGVSSYQLDEKSRGLS